MSNRVLDVDQADLATAAAVLHRLALALLEDVFDSGPGVTHDLWFGAADVRVFDRMPIVGLGWRRTLARFVPPLRNAVIGKGRLGLAAATPRRLRWSMPAVRARLAIDYHGLDGMRIPDHLLGLVGRSAWDAPEFRLQAATALTDHFHSRLIAPSGDFPSPRVAPAVVWMLIATMPMPLPLGVRLRLAHRRERRALERLQRFARAAIEYKALPDDFWSHWIAWHVERRFGVASELPPEWLSRLRFVEDRVEPPAKGHVAELTRRWASPGALAATYAAWYPLNKESRRVRAQ